MTTTRCITRIVYAWFSRSVEWIFWLAWGSTSANLVQIGFLQDDLRTSSCQNVCWPSTDRADTCTIPTWPWPDVCKCNHTYYSLCLVFSACKMYYLVGKCYNSSRFCAVCPGHIMHVGVTHLCKFVSVHHTCIRPWTKLAVGTLAWHLLTYARWFYCTNLLEVHWW